VSLWATIEKLIARTNTKVSARFVNRDLLARGAYYFLVVRT
jgi:hypothetical protein